jgi:hypothetical protein
MQQRSSQVQSSTPRAPRRRKPPPGRVRHARGLPVSGVCPVRVDSIAVGEGFLPSASSCLGRRARGRTRGGGLPTRGAASSVPWPGPRGTWRDRLTWTWWSGTVATLELERFDTEGSSVGTWLTNFFFFWIIIRPLSAILLLAHLINGLFQAAGFVPGRVKHFANDERGSNCDKRAYY